MKFYRTFYLLRYNYSCMTALKHPKKKKFVIQVSYFYAIIKHYVRAMHMTFVLIIVKLISLKCTCRKVYTEIRRITSIRNLLSIDSSKTLLTAFVLPKLDYCNSLFYGSPMYMLERHQKVQNSAARLIFRCRKQSHISTLLMSLHWLPINARIEYKLSVICHSFFLGFSPIYLSDLLLVYTPKRNLRSSSDNGILCIPKLRTRTFGHRSFSFAAPTIWNTLPSELRHTDSIQKFKLALKTHLFGKFYT